MNSDKNRTDDLALFYTILVYDDFKKLKKKYSIIA
jgi:hypothetical protein